MTTDPLFARQLAVHTLLIARGWHLAGGRDPGHDPFADDPTAGWHYPASFGGRQMNEVATTTPVRLQSYFTFDGRANETFALVPAGNLHTNGCPTHDTAEQFVPFTPAGEADLDRIASLLDELEPQAESLDPRAAIECLYFGPCTH
ncbi:hypothetical protein [Amycolatopsis sp. cmx-4-83]|uniref:hypothetical protein n=1 Tax=Amycolatopsis sp. cmx-4-83 TaxID=2790940 RepID=UPI00397E8A39